jgi:drug/metabolite transporter (DMT)-like permease
MSTMNRERHAFFAALLAVFLWSTVATGFKLGLAVLQPSQLLLLGTLISTVVFVFAVTLKRSWQIDRHHLIEAACLGTVNPFLYYIVLFEAYERLPAQVAQPLNYTWAITLAVLAVPALGQRLAGRTIAGIFVSYVGVVVLLMQDEVTTLPSVDWLGVALALGSTVLWAGYWLMNVRSHSDPANLMALSFVIALPLVAVACALGPGFPAITWRSMFYGAWVGLIEMGVTFLLWQRAMRLTRQAARIGQLIFLSPFVSLLLINAVLGESIHTTSILGLLIIVAGLILTGGPRAPQRDAAA